MTAWGTFPHPDSLVCLCLPRRGGGGDTKDFLSLGYKADRSRRRKEGHSLLKSFLAGKSVIKKVK